MSDRGGNTAGFSGPVRPLHWEGGVDGRLLLIDQTLLPTELREIACSSPREVFDAIRRLAVRGAPAIGVAAAYGVCLGVGACAGGDAQELASTVSATAGYLAKSRPTAVNLFWALDRMRRSALARKGERDPRAFREAMLSEAHAIRDEDAAMCRKIGGFGAALLPDGATVLTHCNAGALATAEYGTALGVVYAAAEAGKGIRVYADETRPLLQGARLTAWELGRAGVPVTLIADGAAARVMFEGKIDACIVGADRIAANGDVANKIGTYGVALAARAHGLPFYVAAPSTTFDLSVASGAQIPIEERGAEEVTCFGGRRVAPEGVAVYAPAFDVTPAALVTAIITEKGVIRPVGESAIRAALA